jgi:hypothetical protein
LREKPGNDHEAQRVIIQLSGATIKDMFTYDKEAAAKFTQDMFDQLRLRFPDRTS